MTQPPADGTRWRGFAHKDLYEMLHDGPGATASAEPSRRWAEIASTLTEIGQDLKTALNATGAGWTGPAAGAAHARLSTTVGWATATGTAAATMRTSVEDQAGHIAKARAEMPVPEDVPAAQPDPAVAPAVQVVQTQTDAEPAEAAASSAEQRAVEVMTAYETSSSATTTALPAFTRPEQVIPSTDIRGGQGGGPLGLGLTIGSGLLGGGRDRDDRRDGRGGGGGRGGGYHGTSGQAAAFEGGRRGPSPMMGPGRITGASVDPFLAAPGNGGGRSQDTPRRGNVVGASPGTGGGGGGGGTPGPSPKAGLGGLPGNDLQAAQQAQQAQQAAAAQQAASAHGAGTPMAPGAGAPAGAQEKMAMRRFGMEAIGSSQWFADQDEPVAGPRKRRFDLRESQEVTESVSILDEEHKLPPNVIGE